MKQLSLFFCLTIFATNYILADTPKNTIRQFIISLHKLDFEKSQLLLTNETKQSFLQAKKSFQSSNYFNDMMQRAPLTDAYIIKYYDLENIIETIKGSNAIVKFRSVTSSLEKVNGVWKIVFSENILDEILVEPYYFERLKYAVNDVSSDYYRRADLVPNILNTARSESNLDKNIFSNIIDKRASASKTRLDVTDLSAEKIQQFSNSQKQLTQALKQLLDVSENDDQLSSSESFNALKLQLQGAENRITVSTKKFNDAVTAYNNKFKMKFGYL